MYLARSEDGDTVLSRSNAEAQARTADPSTHLLETNYSIILNEMWNFTY